MCDHDILPRRATAEPVTGAKFTDPDTTAKGEPRAVVPLVRLETLWINTGTLCNIECANCYIQSSPTNDRLLYFTASEATAFFDEIARLDLPTREIGFTGGEPFMNPDFPQMLADALARGFRVLVLTNAMQPLMRPKVRQALLQIPPAQKRRLVFRVSLDHYSEALHDKERGAGSFARALRGMDWLAEQDFRLHIAGRTVWGEAEEVARRGYGALITRHGWRIDAQDPGQLVLFPEMDESADVPEITTACWDILKVAPEDMMCATSRMVVHNKGDSRPTVLPCTLITYRQDFEMGPTLATALAADGGNFSKGGVKLNHPHCARFCVLGGGSCTVT